ncbi:MAG: hypothetical protein V4591_06785 [Bdellovibrionota bacterium]
MSFKIFHLPTKRLLFRYFSICLMLYMSLNVQAEQNEDEEYFLPSFRSGHNLSLFLSGEYTTWSAQQSSSEGDSDVIDSAKANKTIIAMFFRYTYHINIISSFGFFVGSTAGVFASNGSYGEHRNFYPGYGFSFPTVLGGLVQGLGQDFRLLAGVEYGAVWFPQMQITTSTNKQLGLGAVPDMYSIFIGIDNFLTRDTALSFNVGYRQISTPCLNSCSSSIYLNSLAITGKSYYTQLGMTWAVGELGAVP